MVKPEEQEIRNFIYFILLLFIALSIASLVLTDEYFKTPPPKNGKEIIEIEQKRAAIQVINGMPIAIIIVLFLIYTIEKK